MALAPTAEVEFAAIVLSGISFYMFHNTLQTNGTQMAPEARGAGNGAVRSLPLYRPGDRRSYRRPHRRPLGRAAGVLGGGRSCCRRWRSGLRLHCRSGISRRSL